MSPIFRFILFLVLAGVLVLWGANLIISTVQHSVASHFNSIDEAG